MKKTINVIGAGKLGTTIAKLIHTNHAGIIQAVCNQSQQSARVATMFIGAGDAVNHIQDLPPAEITFITTPDESIQYCVEQLAQYPNTLKKNSIVVHCSGVLPSSVLHIIQAQGHFIASAHPMASFVRTIGALQKNKTFCTLEGDKQAITILSELFNAIHFIPSVIELSNKSLYHIAAVFGSNYVVTLYKIAIDCLKTAGISAATGQAMMHHLMQDTLNHLKIHSSPADVITGPIERGDQSTIRNHLIALKDHRIKKAIYQSLGYATLDIVNISDKKKASLKLLLDTSSSEASPKA